MARLKNDKLNLTRRGAPPSESSRLRVILPILVFVALSLMLLSKLNHSALANARWRIAELMSPVLQAAMVPLEPLIRLRRQISAQIDTAGELQRLRVDNQKLSSWEWRARELERKLAKLEALSKTVGEPKIDFIIARVIADTSGAFVRSVVIGAGRQSDVRTGYPVVNADGLIGRVVEIGRGSARVLLPTDLNSRIPVIVGNKNVRAILAGDNGSQPRLTYLAQDAVISAGDEVSTSGVGGIFPRGLRIGAVAGEATAGRVKLRADMDELEYVSVLFFENPELQLIDEKSAAPARSPPAGSSAGQSSQKEPRK